MRYDNSQLLDMSNKVLEMHWAWMDMMDNIEEAWVNKEFVHNLNDETLYPKGFTTSEAEAFARMISTIFDSQFQIWLRAERHIGLSKGTDNVSIVILLAA